MENSKSNRKSIALLSLLAGIAYLYLISIDFINSWDAIANSFVEGYRASAEGREGMLPDETFTLMLNAEKLDNYYCDSLYNLKNDKFLPAKIQLVDVRYHFVSQTDYRQTLGYRVTILILVSLFIIGLVAVPYYFYRIIVAFYKDHIFNRENVRRLNILGCILLVVYLLHITFDLSLFYYKRFLIQIPNYSLSINLSGAEWLFMGLITLLIANILKRSVEYKEEQDLTI